MPSQKSLPTITDFLQASRDAIRGQRDKYGDIHDGAIYDHVGGPTAILFSREAQRDRDAFHSIYLSSADNDDLTTRIQTMWNIPRIVDTFGQGTAIFRRPTAAAGVGTFLTGTRIKVFGNPPAYYQIAKDTLVTGTYVENIPIEATVLGTGQSIDVSGGMTMEDPLYDTTWIPIRMTCADGTNFEEAKAYIARATAQRLNSRNGYIPKIVTTCQAAGAFFVLCFPSNWGLPSEDLTDDIGLNAIYVSDANYQSTAKLVNACTVALESARIMGADLWVGGMVQTPLSIIEQVTLVDVPGKLPLVPIQRAIIQSILAYFGPTQSGYLYKRASLAGVQQQAHPAIQSVAFVSPSTDPTLGPNAWPATLPRYTVASRNIAMSFVGPS